MRLSTQVKPISYVKANAAQIIDDLADGAPPVVVTKNGEAKAIVQSIADYERTQETLAMLKLVALERRDIAAGLASPAADVFERLRQRIGDR